MLGSDLSNRMGLPHAEQRAAFRTGTGSSGVRTVGIGGLLRQGNEGDERTRISRRV